MPILNGPPILPKPATPTTLMSPLLKPMLPNAEVANQTEVAIRLAQKSNYQNILAGDTQYVC